MSALGRRQREFLAAIRGTGRVPASVARYRAQAFAGWQAALGDAYPVVARLVGPAFFAEAARRYAGDHPSASGDLHAYGARFADFLAGYPPAAELAWLADMARLEWALHRAQFAADAPGIDAAALAAVAPERHGELVLVPHPAVAMLRSRWPLAAWWEANQPGRDGTPRDDAAPSAGVLVTRAAAPRPHELDADECEVMEAAREGACLAAIAQRLGDRAEALPRILARLLALGAFGDFRLG